LSSSLLSIGGVAARLSTWTVSDPTCGSSVGQIDHESFKNHIIPLSASSQAREDQSMEKSSLPK
jgi:hypothetical protein